MKNKAIIISLAALLFGAIFLVSEGTMAYAQEDGQHPSTAGYNVSSTPPYPPGGYDGSTTPPYPQHPSSYPNTTASSGYGYGNYSISHLPTPSIIPPTQNQQSVSISGQGKAELNNGQVQSVNGNTLTVSVFGINFTVDITNAKVSAGTILPDITALLNSGSSTPPASSPATINVGDKVSLAGTVSSSTGVISAQTLRDVTAQTQSSSTVQNRINQLLQLINQLRSQFNL